MGKCFSDAVEQALRYIYYDLRLGKGKEGFQLLEQASAAGDGDATCILARCYCGDQYVWSGHGFPVDDDRAVQLLHKSIEQGSALGVLLSMRMGEFTPEIQAKMPFANLQEVFNIVLEKANAGDAFCQFTIGNCYFWWDFVRIQGTDPDSFPSSAAFKNYMKENIVKCEDWFWKAYKGGIASAGNNLYNYYAKGDEDIILPQPEKAKTVWKYGAEWGYPQHQYFWAEYLEELGDMGGALRWYQQAADGGEADGWYKLGHAYENGAGVAKDFGQAAECYQNGLHINEKNIGCCNALGALYFKGNGVPQDYAKAYQLLERAYIDGSEWCVFYLGKCCFYGWGTQQDYTKARTYLEQFPNDHEEKWYMLGYIYGRGLGVQENIQIGAGFLQKAKNLPQAKEELKQYKKSLFGKWSRR